MFDVERVDEARALCRTCPIKHECLGRSYDQPVATFGVFGGLTYSERFEAAQRPLWMPVPVVHGSGSYAWSRCVDGPDDRACLACREANAERSRNVAKK